MLNLILNPKLFNYLLIILYLFAAVRWGIDGNYGNACYWLASLFITIVVTFMRVGM